MERHLNLIKTGHQEVEKRVFPRFPFSYLVFREEGEGGKSYEVKDISYSGMQVSLKDGECSYKEGDSLKGEIHWYSQRVQIVGTVRRVESSNVGVEFSGDLIEKEMKNFLSVENIAKSMRPIHEYKDQMEIPANLAYWLRCDGPFELFVWQHNDHEISKIQVIMMHNYVEWNDGVGLSSGKILSVKNHDTPLSNEEEFEFLIDDQLDVEKLEFCREL
ncbi:PilZ domain-containing protein [Bacteriovorax sp. DB6_IX]|uniref:PilZ domain-containing protein n=1 Tax=Bacteriovorax sp. DB6_IX TaxID=1353530 RepID=UPI00038A0444|nr:PilZ domain-containing protein [Bacteriovorax sp. DB6_IX]EQC51398.1 type IV pilus assembly protein PilZ [Bacteriovorax sp. DB6_IX]